MINELQPSQDLRSLCARRWRSMGLTFGIVLAAGVATFPFLPKQYESSAKLLIMLTDQRIAGSNSDGDALRFSENSQPILTQVELIRVNPVLRQVIDRLNLYGTDGKPLSVEAFAKRIVVEPLKGTDMIQVSYKARDPVLAQRVVATLCEAFMAHTEQERQVGVGESLRFVDEQVARARQQVNQAESRLQQFKQTSGSIALSQEIQASVQAAADLSATIRQRRQELEAARSRAASLRSQLGMNERQALAAAALAQNPRLRALQEQLVAAETSPVRSQGLAADHPEVIALNERTAMLKNSIDAEIRGVLGRKASFSSLGELQLALVQQLSSAETDVLALQAGLRAAQQTRGQVSGQLSVLPARELQLARLSREVELANQLYRQVVQKREEAHLAMAVAPALAHVVSPAEVPLKPTFPTPGQAAPVLLLMGLAAAFGVGALRDLGDRSLKPQQLAPYLPEIKIFASLPLLPWSERRKGEMVALRGTCPAYVEALRTLEVGLENHLPSGTGRVVVLTSPSPGEGKSVTLANLAAALADSGNRVLLVDGDLNRPRVHELMGQDPRRPGWSEVLLSRVAPLDAILHQGDLDVVTSGSAKLESSLSRHKARIAQALDTWRQHYDYILIDLPPMIKFSEVAQYARQADGLLLLANLQRTTPGAFMAAIGQLQAVRLPILGTVAVGQTGNAPHYSSYYLLAEEGSRS